jgi:hypothetical protein
MTDAPLKFHPLADLFPLMEGAEFDKFVADIKANGLHDESITLFEGMVLDGRNRYRALLKISPFDANLPQGAGPEFDVFDGDEAAARAFVISRNIHRRHLTAKQRRDLLVKLVAAQPEKSDRAIGDEIGVDHKAIGRARRKGESTGAIDPVKKRTGTDGKRRRQPTKRNPAAEPKAGVLVWKREGHGTCAETSGGIYRPNKLDADLYATLFWPNNEGDPVSLGDSTSLKAAKGLAQIHATKQEAATGTEDSGSIERLLAEARKHVTTDPATTDATAATAAEPPSRSVILAADAIWAVNLAADNVENARKIYDLLRDDERRTAFVEVLGRAVSATGNDTDATESAETRKAQFKAEEGDEVEAEEADDEDEQPRRRRRKVKEVEVKLGDAVRDAFADLADLGGEIREVVDNSEAFSQTQRIQTLEATADELDSLQEPTVPAELAELPVKYLPGRVTSRSSRCWAATEILEKCMEVLATIPEGDERRAAASELSSELDDLICVRDNCVFPGMYG